MESNRRGFLSILRNTEFDPERPPTIRLVTQANQSEEDERITKEFMETVAVRWNEFLLPILSKLEPDQSTVMGAFFRGQSSEEIAEGTGTSIERVQEIRQGFEQQFGFQLPSE